jgi:hypothetical protein
MDCPEQLQADPSISSKVSEAHLARDAIELTLGDQA